MCSTMARLFSAVMMLLMMSGLPGKCLGYDDYYYYDDEDYDNEPEKNVPKLITGQQVKDIENVTQTTVIRLIERENRIMSKNMDDAAARCAKAAVVFENGCKRCGGDSSVLGQVLKYAEKLMKIHPVYLGIKVGEKVLKKLKKIRIRKIVQKVGKSIGRLAKNIGKTWRGLKKGVGKIGRRIGRKLNRIARRVGRNLNRLARRLGRVARRVGRQIRRLVRLPRIRVRLPRIRVRLPRIRFRFGRRWGKRRKRSSCDECERISKIKGDDNVANAICPFLAAVNRQSSKTDEFLKKLVSEIENGYPKLDKIIHHPYKSTDEAVVTISLKEGNHPYTLKKFKQLSSTQAGRIIGQYIFNRAKQ